jgi:hypothetical protein
MPTRVCGEVYGSPRMPIEVTKTLNIRKGFCPGSGSSTGSLSSELVFLPYIQDSNVKTICVYKRIHNK